MRIKFTGKTVARTALGLSVLIGTAALISAPKSPFSKNNKAYYADENLINYVRPGLVIKVQSANIASDGTIKATVQFTDPKGVPLDINGVDTPGPIRAGNPSMVAAYIPKGQTQYVAYTTRSQTSPITGQTANQAGADSGGTWAKVSDGVYTYTFKTKAPANFDKSATHAIGCYAARDLTEFGLGNNLDDSVFTFVPDGSSKPVTRDVIRTQSCQKCHVDTFAFHGETGRTSVEMCVLCHTPQSVDPDTGNTVDFPNMIHAIHMGKDLPKKPYIIIGNAQSVNDFSDVSIPTDKRNCQVCHEQNTGAAQAMNVVSHPTRSACGGCHNNVNFATGENHVNLPQPNDNSCSQCHIPQGELEFDASILGAHTIPVNSKQLDGINWAITKVDNGTAGKKPTVTFTLANNAGKPLSGADFGRLSLVMGGPTTDYTTKFAGQSTNGYVSEDVTKASCSNGTCTYTFNTAIPANAKGSFSVSLEGRRVQTLNPGTKQEIANLQYGQKNAVMYFSVDGSPVAQRRDIVAIEKCQACHVSLRLHGENRVDNIDHCVVCHNPVENDSAYRPASAGPVQSIDFRQMIHNIHGGAEVKAFTGAEDYIIYGHGGSVNNFSDVAYPGRLATCSACHVGDSYTLPRPNTEAQVSNPRGFLNPAGAETAACLSCHKTVEAASHALSNTTSLGEACAACHGPNSDFGVAKMHAAVSTPEPK